MTGPLFKITSDGTIQGTSITHIGTGADIPCSRVQIDMQANDGVVQAIITVENIELDLITQLKRHNTQSILEEIFPEERCIHDKGVPGNTAYITPKIKEVFTSQAEAILDKIIERDAPSLHRMMKK